MYLDAITDHDEVFQWLAYGPFHSVADLEYWVKTTVTPDRGLFLFAVKDKTRNLSSDITGEITTETFAGVITLMNGSPENAMVEIGHILIAPKFQRTHVLTNACGILLQYCLDPPTDGGLGLRRVQWLANASNKPSVGAAEKLGFRFEGTLRWYRVLPNGKTGPGVRNDGRGPGRDTTILSICFDDWEGGLKESMMQRMVLRKKD